AQHENQSDHAGFVDPASPTIFVLHKSASQRSILEFRSDSSVDRQGRLFRKVNPTETVRSGPMANVLIYPPPGGRRLRKVKAKAVTSGKPSLPPRSFPPSRLRHDPAQSFVLL